MKPKRLQYEQLPLEVLEAQLGYQFRDRELLSRALTHRSQSREDDAHPQHNERLEFLGDAVLKLVVTDVLLERYPNADEGLLTKLRAFLVSDKHLAELAQDLELHRHLILGRSLRDDTVRGPSQALISNTYEALIGAVYSDSSFEASNEVIRRLFGRSFGRMAEGQDGHLDHLGVLFEDYKTALQELCLKHVQRTPQYTDEAASGPPHQRTFKVSVAMGSVILGQGTGRSKKEAGQRAAHQALKALNDDDGLAGLKAAMAEVRIGDSGGEDLPGSPP